MSRVRSVPRAPVLLLAALGVAAGGCGPKVTPVEREPEGREEMRRLVSLYSTYRSTNNGPPANADQLKAWAKKQGGAKLKEMAETDDLDKIFVSPRDHQPFVVLPMNTATARGPMIVIAYEKQGLNGQRYVASAQGSIFEADDARFRELVPNAK